MTTTSPRRRTITIAEMRMEFVARLAAGGALFVVVAGFTWSFAQIKWVADQMGAQPAQLSYAFPFIIDMPALVATALTVALHDRPIRQRAYAWSILVVFTTISWVCNGVHAIEHASIYRNNPGAWTAALSIFIAGLAPLSVVVGMHAWAFALRHSAQAESAATARPAPARAATARATPVQPARIAPAQAARTVEEPARAPGAQPARTPRQIAQARARELYEAAITAEPGVKPDAKAIWRTLQAELGYDGNDATPRRWVAEWFTADAGYTNPPASATVDVTATMLAEQAAAAPEPELSDPVDMISLSGERDAPATVA